MEFRLNKIDPDVRRQVNEATKEGKVHAADHGISVNKDRKRNNENSNSHGETEKKKILVNAVKKENIDIEAFSIEDFIEENSGNIEIKGRFLDIRK